MVGVKLVTVATQSERYFPILVESCKKYGADLVVLGWGQPWEGFLMRFRLMMEYLDTLDDDDIVCFIDAYDVVLLTPLDILENRFRSIGAKIAVAVEKKSEREYFYGSCQNKSINAGTYIGYVSSLKDMLKDICISHNCEDSKLDDQKILTSYCRKNNVYIDVNKLLFQVYKKGEPPLDTCILHGAGNVDMTQVLEKLGYDVTNIERHSWKYFTSSTLNFQKNMELYATITLLMVILVTLVLIYTYYVKD